jgi:glutaredoxin
MTPITVYTKPACVQCNAVFRTLDRLSIEYRRVDISTDPEAREYVMALGSRPPSSTPAPTTTTADFVQTD